MAVFHLYTDVSRGKALVIAHNRLPMHTQWRHGYSLFHASNWLVHARRFRLSRKPTGAISIQADDGVFRIFRQGLVNLDLIVPFHFCRGYACACESAMADLFFS